MTRVPMDDGRAGHLRLDTRARRWRWRWRWLRWRWRRRRWSLRSWSRRRCRHRTTSVHLHRLSVACMCRRRHRGSAWRDRRHRGRAWRDRRHWGCARCSRDHRRRCRCTRKICRERTDRQRWLNHRVSRKQGLQLGVRGRCRGGGVGKIRLVKHVSGDEDPARGDVKASVPLVVRETGECKEDYHVGRNDSNVFLQILERWVYSNCTWASRWALTLGP